MIFTAPEDAYAIPDVALTPFLMERAALWGDKPALIDASSGRVLTYAGWIDAVRRAATSLADRGLRKGDVLAIFSPNCIDYAVAFHAVSLIGGTITTINPLYTADELRHQLKDAGAHYLVTAPPFLDKARKPRATWPCARSSSSAKRQAPRLSAHCSRPTPTRRRSRSIRRTTSWPCPTRAARPGCPRA